MEVKLTSEDVDILCDLVFLGDWLVNSHRLTNCYIEKYRDLSIKMQKLHRHILSPEEKENFDYDNTQFYLDKLNGYIDKYEEESCFPMLAKKLANHNYPHNPQSKSYYDSIYINLSAQEIYRKEIIEKGVSIINVDIPDIDDKLELFRQSLKKNALP